MLIGPSSMPGRQNSKASGVMQRQRNYGSPRLAIGSLLVLNEFRFFVKDVLRVKGNIVLEHGRNVNSLLGSRGFKGDMLTMLVDCS